MPPALKKLKKSPVNGANYEAHIDASGPSSIDASDHSPRTRGQHALAKCKIFALNDDCLIGIFSYLPSIDLCAVKDTCRRFNALADYTAKLRFRGKDEFEWKPVSHRIHHDLTIFMQHFGKYLSGRIVLRTDAGVSIKKMWLLLKHCVILKELELVGVDVHGLPIHQMRKTLQSLECLGFKNCKGRDADYARIINACINLRSVTVFLILSGPTDSLLGDIAHEASNIEEIFFVTPLSTSETFVTNVAELRRLPKLELLFLSCHHFQMAPALEALAERNALKYMLLRDIILDEYLARALDRLDNLELCYLQAHFDMSDTVKKSFEKFEDIGFMQGFFNYRYSSREYD